MEIIVYKSRNLCYDDDIKTKQRNTTMNALRPILRKTEILSFGYGFEAIYHIFVGATEFVVSEKFDDIDLHCERWRKRMANGYLYECILKPEYESLKEAFEHLDQPFAYGTRRKEEYLLELDLDPSEYYTSEQYAKAEARYVKLVEKARKNHKSLNSIYI